MGSLPSSGKLGERLLPSVLDELAAKDPDRVLYSMARTNNPAEGFVDITVRAFSRAVDRCAWYIEEKLGRGEGFPTLTYMGPQTCIYPMMVLGCIKTGYKLLLNSPRNTLEQHLYLFEKTDCNTFLVPPNFPLPVVKQILGARQMRVVDVVADINHWIAEDGPAKPYPYNKTFDEAKGEPLVVLHTSGSTGMPKPIVMKHGTCAPMDAYIQLPSLGYKPTIPAACAGERMYVAFPLFHSAGISVTLPAAIYNGFTAVLGPWPPTADVANAVHLHGNVQMSCLAPMTLVDLSKNPQYVENLSRVHTVAFGGGPLPQAVGDVLSQKTHLCSVLGTTECGVLPNQTLDPEDWAYLSYSPIYGHEFRHFSGDLYEMVVVKNPKFELYQGIFHTFPELDEWNMKDLYAKHPTKDDAWLYKGRSDDIIVFSTGEKLNPLDMENIINANPAVSSALIVGLGRFQSSLLVEAVEPPSTDAEKAELLDAIWPSIKAANKESPSHGRILRDMTIFTSADKPMLKAGKGTVQRQMTLDLYADEIDQLYNALENPAGRGSDQANGHETKGYDSSMSVHDVLSQIIAADTDIEVEGLPAEANLFELGLDSLQVTTIAREINKFLSALGKPESMEAKTVYANPSISALVAVVSALVEGRTVTPVETDEQKMERLLELHTSILPLSSRPAQAVSPDNFVVLLTGSTGSLGSYILDTLLGNPHVSAVYCLNRGPNSSKRQLASQSAKGLPPPSPTKAHFLDGDLSKPYFGLSTQDYKTLLSSVTTIIHNAWQVDFNLSIDSFSKQLSGVRRFVEFSSHSRFAASIFFVSSIGAVGNWTAVTGRASDVPEAIYQDWNVPQPIGYSQSKFVAERILDTVAREADVPTVVCRVGQIAGPTTEEGIWPPQEWLPSLVASSKYLGKLPTSLGLMGVVDWIPVDVLGRGIVELALNKGDYAKKASDGATVYHAVNVQRAEWSRLVGTIATVLQEAGGKKIELVSLEEWVNALRESASLTEDMGINPAIKIMDTYVGMAAGKGRPMSLDTKNTVAVSKALAGSEAVNEALVKNWLRQWAF